MDVVAVAPEKRVRFDQHLDQRIARRRPGAAAETRPALAFEAKDLALLDAGRDRHVEPFLGRQRQPLLAAGRRLGESIVSVK